jgi:ATP-dependent DNA ligase
MLAREAVFIEPMECLAVPKLPDSPEWVYEIKLDGYRAVADARQFVLSSRLRSLSTKRRKGRRV